VILIYLNIFFFLLHSENMSALILQNNTLWHIFEDFTASILLSACFLIYVIRNQFSNHPPTHDNKIANELSAHMTEINGVLTAEIEKNKTRDGSITAEIERLLDVYKKLSTEVNTKIANKLSARLSEINSTFTAKLGRINNDFNNKLNEKVNARFSKINIELNSKLTAEAEKTRHVMMTSL
jgi:DNA anti-recombination protein RmuC